jgi:CheY-like chemotaxis protein
MSVSEKRVRGTILLAEDDEDVRLALQPILTDEGYDVTVARDGT